MRSAKWEQAAGALAALLAGSGNAQLVLVDLYTITTAGGLTLRYTNAQTPVTVNGVTYGIGPIIRRSRTRLTTGIEVDTLDLTLQADSSVTVNGVPLLHFIARNGLDGARLVLDRGFSAGIGQSIVGTLELFSGRLSAPSGVTGLEARLIVRSDAELLSVKVPRNVYQAACLNTLYDPACGVNRATYTATGTAISTTDSTRRVFSHSLGGAAGTYDLGVVTFTSGGNAGVSRTVRSHTSGTLTLMAPLPVAVAVGDAFSISAGCDKRQATCSGRFNNLGRFRGTPYIPRPESIT